MRLTVPTMYAIYALAVFTAGVNGLIEVSTWDRLAFIGYWPASSITRAVGRALELSSFDNGPNATFLGLYASHLFAFAFDVIIGTLWWTALSRIFARIRTA